MMLASRKSLQGFPIQLFIILGVAEAEVIYSTKSGQIIKHQIMRKRRRSLARVTGKHAVNRGQQ